MRTSYADIRYNIVENSVYTRTSYLMCSCFKNSVTTRMRWGKNERLCHLQAVLVPDGVGGVPADSCAAGFDVGTPEDDSVDC
jgi:hypothetical protein